MHRLGGDADADLADHPVRVRCVDGYFRPNRPTEGALLTVDDLVARQRLGRVGADVLAQFVSVRMGQPDALMLAITTKSTLVWVWISVASVCSGPLASAS